MKIFTTPMCQEAVRLAGISEYTVKTDNIFAGADLAIVLSETETNIPTIKIKLNTFKQIYESIDLISNTLKTKKLDFEGFNNDHLSYTNPEKKVTKERKKIKVKVYSNFIREIVQDMEFTILKEKADFLVFPDYMKNTDNKYLMDEIELMGDQAVEIPSHKNAPLNPLKRAQLRYYILESRLCTKP
jgi:segregation and condensation protein B